ncbi:conserved hypothetical protein [Paecilomyces variotii No. 5]|uniref:Cytochrome P450 n=1 Tax=Byssochlamys spectabilis (strain No. 5 / NBRC 109023) TaxID=1356009 RepID=V5FCN1_BYSSN|nr:conserved hypothetical protein [Paecilomyces variotii No. 5]
MLWATLIALPLIYVLNLSIRFLHNLQLARKTNLPYIIFPLFEANLLYIGLFETKWFPYVLSNWAPEWIADYVNDGIFKARWSVKDRMAKKYGGVYLYVTPGGISCNVGDAEVVNQICKARHSFIKPIEHLGRYIAPVFNDRNYALVWTESLEQATQMLDYWVEEHSTASSKHIFTIPDTREDILKLTLNIICSAGFGVKLPFKPTPQALSPAADMKVDGLFKDAVEPPRGYTFTFRGVMEYMNRSLLSVFLANGVLPKWVPRWSVPFFKVDFAAHDDLGRYLQVLVNSAEGDKDESHDLLQSIVRSRRDERNLSEADANRQAMQNKRPGLSDEEVLGNVYIFSIAGHETTATTLRFALVLLALHQDIQDELYDEISRVLSDGLTNASEWGYTATFPNLIMPLCVMLETLRLFPPAPSIPKKTAAGPVSLNYNGQTHHLPPDVRVNLNASALHYSEKYWGQDTNTFDPRRWDKRNASSFLARNDGTEGLSAPGLESSHIHKPARGTYISFSDGMRACIGRRFAQVEFVAVLVAIFSRYRVRLGKIPQDESERDVKRRVEKALGESLSFITLSMREDVPLVFEER